MSSFSRLTRIRALADYNDSGRRLSGPKALIRPPIIEANMQEAYLSAIIEAQEKTTLGILDGPHSWDIRQVGKTNTLILPVNDSNHIWYVVLARGTRAFHLRAQHG